jgi:hypothetical protein
LRARVGVSMPQAWPASSLPCAFPEMEGAHERLPEECTVAASPLPTGWLFEAISTPPHLLNEAARQEGGEQPHDVARRTPVALQARLLASVGWGGTARGWVRLRLAGRGQLHARRRAAPHRALCMPRALVLPRCAAAAEGSSPSAPSGAPAPPIVCTCTRRSAGQAFRASWTRMWRVIPAARAA